MLRRLVLAGLCLAVALSAAGERLVAAPAPHSPVKSTRPLPRGETYVIRGARMLAMTGKPPVPNAVVVVDQGYIVAAGPAGQVRIPKHAQILNAKGLTLLPGFIDMHVHSSVQGGMMPYLLANGITSVRDLGCDEKALPDLLKYREQAARGEAVGPRLFVSGPPIDGRPRAANWFPGPSVSTAAEARQAVNYLADQKVDVIKLYRRLSIADGKAAVEAAHKRGLPVTWDYRWDFRYLQLAALTGVDNIEHVFYSRKASGAELDLLARLLGNAKTWFEPTLVAFRPPSEAVVHDVAFEQLPPGIRSFWKSLFWPMETPDEFAAMRSFVRRVHRQGGRFLVGTDTPVKYVAPGYSFHQEMALLAGCKLSNLEVLEAATHNAALALHKEKELGAIAPGWRADLVLLEANPLEDIRATRQVRWVIRGGRIFSPAPLLKQAKRDGPQQATRLPAPLARF